MSRLLPLTDIALADCRDHEKQCADVDPAILAYLTRHVNGLMCAEIERVVARLVLERLEAGCSAKATLNFVRSTKRNAVRNPKYGEIRNTLNLLGSDYGQRFGDLVQREVGEEGISKLGIAVGKRNTNAHDDPPDITFRELEEAYIAATSIVDAVRVTLWQEANET